MGGERVGHGAVEAEGDPGLLAVLRHEGDVFLHLLFTAIVLGFLVPEMIVKEGGWKIAMT